MNINTSYAICAVQRSGSFLLCEALKNTGLAGFPEEYFLLNDEGKQWENGWWSQQHGATTRRQFLDLVREKGTSANGVFGTKLMWNGFAEAIECLQGLPELANIKAPQVFEEVFPNMHYIWLVRGDKVRQAVSWSIAAQTGFYSAWQQEEAAFVPEAHFDFEQIDLLHRLILEGEAGWQGYFADNGIEPFKVTYEALVADFEGAALRILDFMGITYPDDLVFAERKIKKQGTSRNAEWAARYREHAG